MSVQDDDSNNTEQISRSKEEEDHRRARKRKRAELGDIESSIPKKKHQSRNRSYLIGTQATPSRTPKPPKPKLIESSPFHQQTSSLYLPLPPIAQNYPLQGLCAEHLSPLILTYYPPLRGIILSYRNVRLSTTSQSAYGAGDEPVLAQAIDEYAAPHVWVTADFLLLRPLKGNVIEGWINLQNEGNIGLVCWNFFNASIEKKRLPRGWNWKRKAVDSGVKASRKKLKGSVRGESEELDQVEPDVQANGFNDIQGRFEDENGRRVEGLIKFMVKDIDTSRSSGGDNGFISIEGTLLDEAEERELIRQENSRCGKHRRKERDGVHLMSGALVSEESEESEGAAGRVSWKPRNK